MLTFGSDISGLISAMNEAQRSNFVDFINILKSQGLDDKLKDQMSEFRCDDLLEDIVSTNNYEQRKSLKEHAAHKGESTIPKDKWGVHTTHCCKFHGCKYGEQDCPVELELVDQVYPCEWCEDGEEDPNKIFKKK